MEFGRDEFERDQLHLPVDAEVQAVMREGDRVTAEVLHSPLPSERSPLLTKSQSASSTEDSDASGPPPPSPQARDDASTNEIIRHESYYLVKLFVPMLLTQFAQVVADSTLSMLIGHTTIGADTKMLAALTLTSMYPALLVITIYMGIISAVDTLCAQAFGGKRLAELWLFIQAGILLCTATMPLLVGLTLSAAPVLGAMGQDPVIIEMSKPVLIVSAFTLVPMIAYTFGTSALRAQNIAIPCTIATIAGWVISTPMAWYLAFYTPLGYVGIAMQTTISSTVQAVIVLYAVTASDGFAHWPGWQLQAATRLALKMAKLSGSGMLMVGCSSGAIMIFSIIGGMLPDAATVVTASGIFLSMLMYMLVTENSIGGASAVRIGNALGRGQAKRAKMIMLMSTAANALVGLVEMLAAIVIAESFANIFTTDANAARVAAQMIRQLSPMFLITGFYASAQAALMACGKQFACAVMGFVTIAVVGLPIGLWFAISLDGGIVGLWYGSIIGFLLCVLAEFAWIWRLDWDAVALDAKHKTHIELSESSSAQSVPPAA